MRKRTVVVLAGGTGSIKLVRGFASLPNVDLTVISNVGDNIWLHGLYVCPDIDTVLYGLSGLLDRKRGWGVSKETFNCLGILKKMGADAWFGLGDKDLAMHIKRTEMLRRGMTLTEFTAHASRAHNVTASILPASDDHIETIITTPEGRMHLQEFWVKLRGKPKVLSVNYSGIESARATDRVKQAISAAWKIIISPANPISSVGPIVDIAGIRDLLSKKRESVIAVSPLVGSDAFSGPAVKYMKARGVKASVEGVADFYSEIAGTLAISRRDSQSVGYLEQKEIAPLCTNIVMKAGADETRLARELISEPDAE